MGGHTFRLDASRWSQADRIIGIATLVLFLSMFMPWFSVSTGFATYTADGPRAHGFLFIVLLVSLAVVAYLVMEAGFAEMPFRMPFVREQFLLGATGLNLLLVLIGFFLVPDGYASGVGWGFGAFVGLIAAVVAFAPLVLPIIRARTGKR